MSTARFALLAGLAFGTAAAFSAPTVAAEEAAAQNAKISIVQAIATAEQKGMGKATEADFDDDKGGRWEVKVLSDGGSKLTEYYVDATSGQITGEEEQTFEKYFTMLKPENFQKAQVQLKDAIGAAEALAKGKATSAEVERDGEAVSYEIDVATADGDKDVKVDAMGKAMLD
ncbi:MAG: hypothetical protein DI565_15185 [Ancylobacter novellus]|uniref:PepSY domain-containing protein n=1 Tax=Ancylobacter novellus TaxID=921 RepID=A0A2W5K7Z4_ANCNO|nr:MAG: hypothetical protein DI565_15185 [Ancylobacter novellus]